MPGKDEHLGLCGSSRNVVWGDGLGYPSVQQTAVIGCFPTPPLRTFPYCKKLNSVTC